MICNGGSATVYQALREGVPVLGIPSNMDQHLTMSAVEQAGAGILLRAERATAKRVRQATDAILGNRLYQDAARALAHQIEHCDATERFRAFVDEMLPVAKRRCRPVVPAEGRERSCHL